MAEMTIEQQRAFAIAKAKAAAAGAAPKDTGNQHVDASTVYVDDMLFGLPGKAAAGLNALVRAPFTDKSIGEEYSTLRDQYQNARKQYAEEHPVANAAASIAGSIHGGATAGGYGGQLIGRGASALSSAVPQIAPALNWTANALGNTYPGRMAGEAASGAVQGGLSAFGHDEDVGTGAGIGAAVGGLARPVTSLAGGALSSLGSLVGLGNNSRAQNAIAQAILRSGRSADDVVDDVSRAAQQGQPEYMVADALGNSGQRMLTGVARSPGDMRQEIAETLQRRQAGQTDRLVNALSEGFDAPQTAAQTRNAMTSARDAAADVNYNNARNAAGVVDPTAAIQSADNFLQPGATGVMSNESNIADDSVEALVRRARGYLTDGNNVLTDFNVSLRAKRELDRLIAKNPDVRELYPIRNALDDALASTSQPYAAARDQFRRESQAINAIDQGTAASSARTRAADNIDQFNQLAPDQQQPFRVGYVDPLIAKTEAASMSPTTNKARGLITGKTEQEFPAFAAPGRGDVMGERIAREQRMFETANQALGGSRTADNLADATEMMGFDPTILGIAGNALTGNFRSAGMQALQRGVNVVQGRNQGTRDMIARMLLQSDPTQARAELASAVRQGQTLTRAQQAIINSIIGAGSTAYSR